jgi:hypothetical protein
VKAAAYLAELFAGLQDTAGRSEQRQLQPAVELPDILPHQDGVELPAMILEQEDQALKKAKLETIFGKPKFKGAPLAECMQLVRAAVSGVLVMWRISDPNLPKQARLYHPVGPPSALPEFESLDEVHLSLLREHPVWANPQRTCLLHVKTVGAIREQNQGFPLALRNLQSASMLACLFHACALCDVAPVLVRMMQNGHEVDWDWPRLLRGDRAQCSALQHLPKNAKELGFTDAVCLWAYTCGPGGEGGQNWYFVCTDDATYTDKSVVQLEDGYSVVHGLLRKSKRAKKLPKDRKRSGPTSGGAPASVSGARETSAMGPAANK